MASTHTQDWRTNQHLVFERTQQRLSKVANLSISSARNFRVIAHFVISKRQDPEVGATNYGESISPHDQALVDAGLIKLVKFHGVDGEYSGSGYWTAALTSEGASLARRVVAFERKIAERYLGSEGLAHWERAVRAKC